MFLPFNSHPVWRHLSPSTSVVAMAPGHMFRSEQNAMDTAPTSACIHCRMSGYLTTLFVSVCLSVQELSLDSGAEAQVMVTFDPSYCSDKLSRREERQLAITFREHTHKVRLCCCVGSAPQLSSRAPSTGAAYKQLCSLPLSVPFLSLFPSSLRTSSICHQRSTFPTWTLTPKRFVCVYIHVPAMSFNVSHGALFFRSILAVFSTTRRRLALSQ